MVSHTPSVKDHGYYTHVIEGGNLVLLRRCLLNDSIAQKFYNDLLFYLVNDQQHSCSKTLVSRALFYAQEYNIDLKRYIFSDKYINI